jgi:hypothetical protein
LITIGAGAGFFLALKDNQLILHELAKAKLDARPAGWTSDLESGHGRIEWRELRVCGFDLDTALFPGARQVVGITRFYCDKVCAQFLGVGSCWPPEHR